ncbi:Multimodular transpeptidase-transglycosylase [Candidatus Palibaumannia cicadellinicola]|uniref:Penicillin-binding protein 1B n=1 Tax=Candidatus Palibaumannia cicadellinicola TaxID=186490 RepID=A0A0K2BKE6_9GAMM|nr:Multimodular transpeptidase-transglycosylase [Candidatus Baumannia cicadellinicola]
MSDHYSEPIQLYRKLIIKFIHLKNNLSFRIFYIKIKQHICINFLYKLIILLLMLITLIIIYGFYLDTQLRYRINGNIWQLPAAVYGRIVHLEPGMSYSLNDLVRLLEVLKYSLVSKITRPGEFIIRNNSIELFRRSFPFPDGKEGPIRTSITFKNKKVLKINHKNIKNNIGLFRLDPKLITILPSTNGEQRFFLPLDDFPPLLVETLIATEDRYFYQHYGIRLTSIFRAFLANFTAGHTIQGGSTLTQQLVKNLFFSNKRSFWRKLNEAYMALLFDYHYSKDRILALYLNDVYLGQSGNEQIRGFPLASMYYFGRPINEISLEQQAMLVGMVKGASLYNPLRHPKLTIDRRNIVLKCLEAQNIINLDLYKKLISRPLNVQLSCSIFMPPHSFINMVYKEFNRNIKIKINTLSGIKIFTTLDPVSQCSAERAIKLSIPILRKKNSIPDLESAMVVVDRFSGEILSMVGGSDTRFAGFNRAMHARRSVGSLAKSATYITALSQPNKYRLNTWITDEPLAIPTKNCGIGSRIWFPKNYDRQFRGKVMLIDAFTYSINVPMVNLGIAVGLNNIINTFIKLGIPVSVIHPIPSIILGAISLTPLEIAQQFQTIANYGNHATLSAVRAVISEDGKILYQSLPQSERVIPAQAAYLTLYAMQQVVERGTSILISEKFSEYNIAAKTGTTNELRDSWVVGIDGKEVTVIWLGKDNNEPAKLTGSTGALTVYNSYLNNKTPIKLNLIPPEGIINMYIDLFGKLVCAKNSGLRPIPIWTDDPISLCNIEQGFPTGANYEYEPRQKKILQLDKKNYLQKVFGWLKIFSQQN